MEELYKKDLNEPDSSDGVVSHPEPDIQRVKSSGLSEALLLIKLMDAIKLRPLEDVIKVLHSLCQQIWKT